MSLGVFLWALDPFFVEIQDTQELVPLALACLEHALIVREGDSI